MSTIHCVDRRGAREDVPGSVHRCGTTNLTNNRRWASRSRSSISFAKCRCAGPFPNGNLMGKGYSNKTLFCSYFFSLSLQNQLKIKLNLQIVSLFAIAGGLAVDCVRQGHPEFLPKLIEGMAEVIEDELVAWINENGGWVCIFVCFQYFQFLLTNVSCFFLSNHADWLDCSCQPGKYNVFVFGMVCNCCRLCLWNICDVFYNPIHWVSFAITPDISLTYSY